VELERYFEINHGSVPIVLSCPHGGYLKPSFIDDKKKGFKIPDRGTFLIAKEILNVLRSRDLEIYSILSKIHRTKIDFNRPGRFQEAFNHQNDSFKIGRKFHSFYHTELMKLVDICITEHNKCFFIDFHGFTKPNEEYPDIIIGCLFGNTLNIYSDHQVPSKNEFEGYWGYSHLIKELSNHFMLDNGLGKSNYNIAYAGGYITYQFYKKEMVNAIQLEVSKDIRRDLEKLNKFISAFTDSIQSCLS